MSLGPCRGSYPDLQEDRGCAVSLGQRVAIVKLAPFTPVSRCLGSLSCATHSISAETGDGGEQWPLTVAGETGVYGRMD